jgi:hypothetical protein
MMESPKIKTAIPKRRYAIGDFGAVLLGEVESGDSNRYEYIFALVRGGEVQPCLYITSERTKRSERERGSHRLRLIGDGGSEVIGVSDQWRDANAFVEQALKLATNALQLGGEHIARIL